MSREDIFETVEAILANLEATKGADFRRQVNYTSAYFALMVMLRDLVTYLPDELQPHAGSMTKAIDNLIESLLWEVIPETDQVETARWAGRVVQAAERARSC